MNVYLNVENSGRHGKMCLVGNGRIMLIFKNFSSFLAISICYFLLKKSATSKNSLLFILSLRSWSVWRSWDWTRNGDNVGSRHLQRKYSGGGAIWCFQRVLESSKKAVGFPCKADNSTIQVLMWGHRGPGSPPKSFPCCPRGHPPWPSSALGPTVTQFPSLVSVQRLKTPGTAAHSCCRALATTGSARLQPSILLPHRPLHSCELTPGSLLGALRQPPLCTCSPGSRGQGWKAWLLQMHYPAYPEADGLAGQWVSSADNVSTLFDRERWACIWGPTQLRPLDHWEGQRGCARGKKQRFRELPPPQFFLFPKKSWWRADMWCDAPRLAALEKTQDRALGFVVSSVKTLDTVSFWCWVCDIRLGLPGTFPAPSLSSPLPAEDQLSLLLKGHETCWDMFQTSQLVPV